MNRVLRSVLITYSLEFKKSANKEWAKLGVTLKEQFKKKLIERLENPHVPASKLSGADNLYKIKLRQSGYRLVYRVEDDVVIVTVLAVGKRERNDVYRKAMSRLNN
jgi:mRNA interferase RelE/StbE